MTNIQKLIKTELDVRKKKNPHFSLRSFAQRLEVSPAQLSQILNGKRPVTLKFIQNLVTRLDFSPTEAKTVLDQFVKDKGLKTNNDSKIDSKKQLNEEVFKLISEWYHLGILSLTKIKDAKADPRWVSSQLGISITEASQALTRLQKLGLIAVKPSFKQIAEPFEISSDIPSEAIRRYHKQNLNLAHDKIESIPNHLRDFQSITIPIHTSQIQKFKKLINDMLDLSLEISQKNNPDQVYNLNVQFFPITKIITKK